MQVKEWDKHQDKAVTKARSERPSWHVFQRERALDEVLESVEFECFDRVLIDPVRARRARLGGALVGDEFDELIEETKDEPATLASRLTRYNTIKLPERTYGVVDLGKRVHVHPVAATKGAVPQSQADGRGAWGGAPFVRVQYRVKDYVSPAWKDGPVFVEKDDRTKEHDGLTARAILERAAYEKAALEEWRQNAVKNVFGRACALFKLRGDKVPDWCEDQLLVCVRLLDSSPDETPEPEEGELTESDDEFQDGAVPCYGGILMQDLPDSNANANAYQVFLAKHILCPIVMMKDLYSKAQVRPEGLKSRAPVERYLMNSFI